MVDRRIFYSHGPASKWLKQMSSFNSTFSRKARNLDQRLSTNIHDSWDVINFSVTLSCWFRLYSLWPSKDRVPCDRDAYEEDKSFHPSFLKSKVWSIRCGDRVNSEVLVCFRSLLPTWDWVMLSLFCRCQQENHLFLHLIEKARAGRARVLLDGTLKICWTMMYPNGLLDNDNGCLMITQHRWQFPLPEEQGWYRDQLSHHYGVGDSLPVLICGAFKRSLHFTLLNGCTPISIEWYPWILLYLFIIESLSIARLLEPTSTLPSNKAVVSCCILIVRW